MFKKNWIGSTNLRRLAFWALVVLAWDLAFRFQLYRPDLFPSPERVASALYQGISGGTLLTAVGTSMSRAFLGYGISLLLGLILGFLMGVIRWVDDTIGGMAVALQSLPAACWLPIAILWFGLSETAVLFVIVVGGMFPIAVATVDGIRHVSPLLINAAKTLGTSRRQLVTQVIFPASLPFVLTGMKLGWAFAWRALMTGELLYAAIGLGRLLETGRKQNQLDQIVAVMVILVVISVAVDRLILDKIQTKVRHVWGLSGE